MTIEERNEGMRIVIHARCYLAMQNAFTRSAQDILTHAYTKLYQTKGGKPICNTESTSTQPSESL